MSLPELVVEVAFTTDPDATFPDYEDISDRVLSVSTQRGRQHELDTVQAGTCTIRFDNGDRALDPTYTHSPYHPYVLPMRKVRVSAVWSTVTYYLFTGYVERWPISWEAPNWGSVTITAIDDLATLAQANIAGVFPEEKSGARIARVLSAAGWPDSTPVSGGYWTLGTSALGTTTILSYTTPETVIDTGQTTVAAVTIDEGSNTSALSHIQEVVAAERGMFFIDGQGRAVFQDRTSRYGAASAVTFTDDLATLSASRLKYQELAPDFSIEQVKNEVIVTRTGGIPQTATDVPSITHFRRRTMALDLALTTDTEALARAQFELSLRKDPRLEFTNLSVKPQAQDAAWPFALGLELSNMVTVERTPDSVDAITVETIDRDTFIEAVEHAASPSEWKTSYQLSPADLFTQFFILGTAELDSEASAVLAY